MRPKKGAGIYTYNKQSCEKTPHQPSPITPQIHIQLPEMQQFSKEKRISRFKQSKTLLSKESVRNTERKKEALKRAENPKPKKTFPPKIKKSKPKKKKKEKKKEKKERKR